MKGKPLPAFSLPSTTGERYQRQKGDKFISPVIIAILDPSISSTKSSIEAMRSAVDMTPQPVDLIFASISTDIDALENATGLSRRGEYMLISARSLARSCGVGSYPTFFIIDRSGNVSDVIIGYSNNLATSLLEKLAIID